MSEKGGTVQEIEKAFQVGYDSLEIGEVAVQGVHIPKTGFTAKACLIFAILLAFCLISSLFAVMGWCIIR